MAPADEINLPPGFGFTFDFKLAVKEIRERLSPTFLENEWVANLRKILAECAEECQLSDSDGSILIFQITFLDLLWTRPFGVASGSSPWKSFRDSLDPHTYHGGKDAPIYGIEVPDEKESTEEKVLEFVERQFWPEDDSEIIPEAFHSTEMLRLLNEYHSKVAAEANV
ncbi:Mitochondrial-processing peptidase subunit alpha [Pestalotiopsis sp. IQ-011]